MFIGRLDKFPPQKCTLGNILGCSLKELSSQKVNLFHGVCLRIFTAGSVSESGCGAGIAGVPCGLAGAAVDQSFLERQHLIIQWRKVDQRILEGQHLIIQFHSGQK